jgi:UDP-N-acetylmuramoyl-L-alanyl-D-glutamate--2,6-diaminopimelate ligase
MIKSLIKKITPKFLLSAYHYILAFLGALFFGFPSRKLVIIGITGTSGKSTTTDLVCRILEEAGKKVASISTIRFKIAEKEWKNNLKMTMPGRFKIQKFLRQAVKEKCDYAVLEVSSEGIRQFRHKFINFKTAVFTNLSKEHIESHGSFENYRNEKIKFFKAVKDTHIINIDDANAKYFLKTEAKKVLGFSLKKVENLKIGESGSSFQLQDTKFQIQLPGEFNIYNALCAISAVLSENISLEICRKALEKAKGIPGRMEIIQESPFKIIIDYAHTPDQLENVYKVLAGKNLVCVLGSCGGGRDKWKRPVLGEIAAKYCKEIIVTNEDPYDENPEQIIEQIISGVSSFKLQVTKKIINRREAIKTALSIAKENDAVIITGKGSETLMCLENGKKITWSDKDIVLEELQGLTFSLKRK